MRRIIGAIIRTYTQEPTAMAEYRLEVRALQHAAKMRAVGHGVQRVLPPHQDGDPKLPSRVQRPALDPSIPTVNPEYISLAQLVFDLRR